jgi:hypothetical protein
MIAFSQTAENVFVEAKLNAVPEVLVDRDG